MAVLNQAGSAERLRFKKASAEFAEASLMTADIERKRAEGPPPCYTIGCQANYEYDLWRYQSKDDFTGEGLEKANGILKPKGFTFEKPEEPTSPPPPASDVPWAGPP